MSNFINVYVRTCPALCLLACTDCTSTTAVWRANDVIPWVVECLSDCRGILSRSDVISVECYSIRRLVCTSHWNLVSKTHKVWSCYYKDWRTDEPMGLCKCVDCKYFIYLREMNTIGNCLILYFWHELPLSTVVGLKTKTPNLL